jgi:hypothetical protein
MADRIIEGLSHACFQRYVVAPWRTFALLPKVKEHVSAGFKFVDLCRSSDGGLLLLNAQEKQIIECSSGSEGAGLSCALDCSWVTNESFPTSIDRVGRDLIIASSDGTVRRIAMHSRRVKWETAGAELASAFKAGEREFLTISWPTVRLLPNGCVAVADKSTMEILLVSANGGKCVGRFTPHLRSLTAMAVDTRGLIYLLSHADHMLRVCQPDGTIVLSTPNLESIDAHACMAVDDEGHVIVGSPHHRHIIVLCTHLCRSSHRDRASRATHLCRVDSLVRALCCAFDVQGRLAVASLSSIASCAMTS